MDGDAQTLASAYLATVSRRSLWRWLNASTVPSLEYALREDDNDRCPRCNRRLPSHAPNAVAVAPLGLSGGVFKPPSQELAYKCLVDGPRHRSALDLPVDELLDAGRRIAEGLVEKGWRRWAATIGSALDREDVAERAETLGFALRLLDRFGPARQSPALETLIASLGVYWPCQV